jgi:lipopolysaccharide cholinephosphotransferase
MEREQPAWIDIYPLDGIPDNLILSLIHKFQFLFCRLIFHLANFDKVNLTRKDRSFTQRLLIKLGKRIHKNFVHLDSSKLLFKMENILAEWSLKESKYVVSAYSSHMFKEQYKSEWFYKTIPICFEGYEFNAPQKYQAILEKLYGNFMIPIHVNERNNHVITKIEIVK